MSTEFEDRPKAIDKEQRKKDKAKRRKAEKEKTRLDGQPTKKRRVEEIGAEDGEAEFGIIESSQVTVMSTPSKPAKRLRTEESVVQVPDSQEEQLGPLDSPFHGVTASIRVSVPPVCKAKPLEGICVHYLSPLILSWNPQLKGVIMAYNKPRLSVAPVADIIEKNEEEEEAEDGRKNDDSDESDDEETAFANSVDECAFPYIWVTAHFLILRPKKNTYLAAHINLQTEADISLILWNLFSVSISKEHLPKKWKWVDDDTTEAEAAGWPDGTGKSWGSWRDEHGKAVKGMLRFRVLDFDVAAPTAERGTGDGYLSIEGSLLSEKEEKAMLAKDGAVNVNGVARRKLGEERDATAGAKASSSRSR